jgi:hypothetical protein
MAHNNGRRVLYAAGYLAAMAEAREELHRMNADLHCMNAELQREVAALRAELDGVRAAFDELRAAVLARQKAEVELADLRRLQAIGRARAAERDPNAALN